MQEMMLAMEQQTSDAVKLWMNWMSLIFVLSVVFAWKYPPARWVLLASAAVLVMALVIWEVSGNIHLFGIGHFIAWVPLLVYLYRKEYAPAALAQESLRQKWRRPSFVWVSLLTITIIISLIFDARDIALIALGMK